MTQTLLKTVANFETTLSAKLTSTGTSLTLVSANDSDGNALTAGTYGFTISEGESNEEHIVGVVSGSTVSSLVRNVQRNDGTTAQTGNIHRKGASIKITNFPAIQRIQRILDGTTDLDSGTPIKYDGNPSITDNNHLATKKYVDGVANAGAADASTTVKGIAEEATETEVVAGTGTGGTGARLFVNPGSIVDKILTALERTWVRAIEGTTTPTEVNQLAGTTNIAEADTFFGSTDITGAEAETLTNGSDASSLHTHTLSKKLSTISADVTVTNTITETNLLQVSVPANTLGTSNAVKAKLYITDWDQTNGTSTLTIRLKYGATTIATASISNISATGFTFTNYSGTIEALLIGTGTNTQEGVIDVGAGINEFKNSSATFATPARDVATGTATETESGALNLTITAQWNIANPANSITISTALLEIISA